MKKLIAVSLLMTITWVVSAQNTPTGKLYFDHLFIKDGLPEGTVTTMIQDKEGYIWIGTQKGLVRYDGYTPKVYMLGINTNYVLIISKIYQDSQDRIWVGKFNTGLYLYDRSNDRFVQYILDSTKTNPYSISGTTPFITNIYDDQKGNLWVTTSDWLGTGNSPWTFSLYKLNLKTNKVERYGKKEKNSHYVNTYRFYDLFTDNKGQLWVTTDNGLFKYNEQTAQFEQPSVAFNSHGKSGLHQIYQDPSHPNVLWFTNAAIRLIYRPVFSSGNGLYRYDINNNTVTVFLHQPGNPESIASDTIYDIKRDKNGHLWIATEKGISLYNPLTQNFTNYLPNDNYSKTIRELKEDKGGNLWCASPDGLITFNTHTREFIRYNTDEIGDFLHSSNATHHLLIDKRGTLWFGDAQKGLFWINQIRSRFIQYTDNPRMSKYYPGGKINSIAEAKDGTIWIGSGTDIYHWIPQTNIFSELKINGRSIPAQAIITSNNGEIWIGNTIGLYRYDPKTGRSKHFQYNKNDSTTLSNNEVMALLEDHLGNIWVGTFGGGICRFNQETQNFVRYPYLKGEKIGLVHQKGTDNGEINVLYEDRRGTIWTGCNTYGSLDSLNRKTGTFTSFAGRASGFSAILGIREDAEGRLWAGTFISGIFCLNPGRDTIWSYNQNDGLLYDRVAGILVDDKGNLWLPSARGISILNPQTKKIRNITKADGLPSENLLWGFKINDSLYLFSTNNGFFTLNPENFIIDPEPPVIHLQSVHFINLHKKNAKDSTVNVFGKSTISLAYNDNRLTFHYVGLYYQNAHAIKYAYKLDGYDNNWLEAGANRTVTYTNLSPGNYTFKVKAAANDGVWSKEDSVTVIIHSPWWQTWWAYLIYILILVVLVWGFINYRSRNLKRKNQILEKKVSQRTNELRQSLENLKSTQKQLIQSEKMASLGELTAGIAHEIQNPLNFVNNFSDINTELIGEADQEIDKGNVTEAKAILNDIKENEEKINHHGKRADAIVKGMLQHSRTSTGQKEPTDINALCDEYLRLAYHGMRAKDKSFNCEMKAEFDSSLPKINVVPQDIGRVLLNLINNAFYACAERNRSERPNLEGFQNLQGLARYLPTVTIGTKKLGDKVEIRVRDNGNGIPEKIKDKIFQPFFTTKPTGQGTGLGLSLSYDIIKAHGGEIKTESSEGEGTKFIVSLPL